MISDYIYRKILERIGLSRKELYTLRNRLREENICYGPFVKNGKMCPTTTALSIKLKVGTFKENAIVRRRLKEADIPKYLLILFYLSFDIPSMLSHSFFVHRLREFRSVVDDIIEKKN